MSQKLLTDLIIEAAQVLKAKDAEKFAPVIRWMMEREQDERKASKPARKRKQVLYTPRGEKVELYRDTVQTLAEPNHEE